MPIGSDGKPMTSWQIWLHRLCLLMIAWAVAELLLAALLWASYLLDIPGIRELIGGLIVPEVSTMTLLVAILNLIIGPLGIRGAKDPRKITVFFWIVFIDAMLTAWALASSVSYGICDLASLISGLFVIALAVCAWQVRGQTGYFDEHP